MPLLLMSPIPARLIQVMRDFLPAELTSIDSQAADGFTTPSIPTNNYHAWDRPVITEYPAMSIRAVSSIPLDVKPDTFGQRADVVHRIDILFHGSINVIPGSERADLQKLLHRLVLGGVRVLSIMKEGLQTVADPTRWGSPNVTTVCTWEDPATYGPEADQDGVVVRTAVLPIRVRRIEAR